MVWIYLGEAEELASHLENGSDGNMVKCILKGLQDIDAYSGEMAPFSMEYNGIPEACSMWASGYKHAFLWDCRLYYADSGLEIPDKITDYFYNRYYYGRFIFDENGEEVTQYALDDAYPHLESEYGCISPIRFKTKEKL